ncbi:MAG TPA: multicopper oxidase domain-containing protein [Candidatus Methylomirabilis sp.]|nr:multicopper oxidase domain-containing protein [Candidatus Methylomirabilis sp.]
MNRRDFVRLGWATVIGAGAGKLRPAFAESLALQHVLAPQQQMAMSEPKATGRAADFTLRIVPTLVELAPQVVISTIGYNSKVPGPLMRMREGQPVTVDVVNDTDVPEYVHWHGLFVPPEVDGAEEEGTPPVSPHGRRRYQFVAKPAGSRWYHSHTAAMMDLQRGAYTGQFGFLMIDSGNDPGLYDQEVFVALRDWQPYLSTMDQDEAADPHDPMPEKPAPPDPRPNGLEVGAPLYSINDKMLGAGDPLRVQPGQRILMRLLNASASQIHRVALPAHKFQVIALDGNPVPSPQLVSVIEIAPGERVDTIVEMNQPGVWILGELRDVARTSGMGIVVEYANQRQQRPIWLPPPSARWDYTIFGKSAPHSAPDQTIDMVFEKVPGGPHGINHWLVNGKEYPHEQEFVLRQGRRYRLVFHNRSDDSHPLHMHRHLFELVELNGKPTAGIKKDTVIVPAFGRASVDLIADQPGLTLFHCHIQQHMDFGFKALFRYA